jgi:hypothetical protein
MVVGMLLLLAAALLAYLNRNRRANAPQRI